MSVTQLQYAAGLNYQIEDISEMHNLIGLLLVSFNGGSEIFYPKFYKIFIDNSEAFKGLSHECSMLLVMEIANLILRYITRATFIDDVPTFSYNGNQFTEKEKSIITYIIGYVFGTMFHRMRFSKLHNTTLYHQQCLSFVMAGKCKDEKLVIPEHKHVELLDRGGLWKVNTDVVAIFSVAES